MKILVFILAPIGDTLFTTPALKALRNGYPDAKIEVMVYNSNREILEGNTHIDSLVISKGKSQLITELRDLKNEIYDLAIGLSSTGSYLTYFVNARKKIGFKSEEFGWMYDFNVPDDRSIHAVDYCLDIVKTAGAIPDSSPGLEIPVTEENRSAITAKLISRGVNLNLPLIIIHPGGKYFTLKRWPPEKFRKLIKEIDREYHAQIILVGGADDKELANQLIEPDHHYYHLPEIFAGELQLKDTAALMEKADLFIGNDSAPQHLAAAVHVPVISLFGPTDVANFHPYGTAHRIVRADLSCSPCFSWLGDLKQYLPEYLPEWASKCKGACMDSITVEEVLKEVESFISRPGEKKIIAVTGGE